jgi:hypothetical protein
MLQNLILFLFAYRITISFKSGRSVSMEIFSFGNLTWMHWTNDE